MSRSQEKGPIHFDCLPEGQAIDEEHCIKVRKRFGEMIRRDQNSEALETCPHQDSAPCHKYVLVTTWMAGRGRELIPHPTYDLFPLPFDSRDEGGIGK